MMAVFKIRQVLRKEGNVMKHCLRKLLPCILALMVCLFAYAEGLPGEVEHEHILNPTVTTPATCTEDGEQIVTCTVEGCDYRDTELIPAGHKYVDKSDDTQHWQECSVCEEETGRGDHWISCVDGLCRHCGQKGTNEPDHNGELRTTDTEHWQICIDCGEKFGDAEHWISCVDGLCRACGQKGTNQPEHNNEDSDPQFNDTEHWWVCIDCGEKFGEGDHWISCVDGLCRHCGQKGTNTPDHSYDDSDLQFNDTEHWWVCRDCKQEFNMEAQLGRDQHWISCVDGLCRHCGQKGTNQPDHISDDSDLQFNDTEHWWVCRECKQELYKTSHWISCVDGLCRHCGQKGTNEPDHVGELETTDTEHWWPCPECGQDVGRGEHEYEDGVCVHCGYQKPTKPEVHTHAWVRTDHEAETCTEDGYTSYACDCGQTRRDAIPATGHSFSNIYTASGEDEHSAQCLNGCGEVSVKSCTWTETVIAGQKLEVCGVCGANRLPAADTTTAANAGEAVKATAETDAPITSAVQTAIVEALISAEKETPVANAVITEIEEGVLPTGASLVVREREAVIADSDLRVKLFVISLVTDGRTVSLPGAVRLQLPCEMDEEALAGFKLVLLSDDGEMIEVSFIFEDGELFFETDTLGIFALVPVE